MFMQVQHMMAEPDILLHHVLLWNIPRNFDWKIIYISQEVIDYINVEMN